MANHPHRGVRRRIVGPDGRPVGTIPCYDCECCTEWTAALEVMARSIREHVAGEFRVAPCSPSCLVCAEIDWRTPLQPPDLGGSAA